MVGRMGGRSRIIAGLPRLLPDWGTLCRGRRAGCRGSPAQILMDGFSSFSEIIPCVAIRRVNRRPARRRSTGPIEPAARCVEVESGHVTIEDADFASKGPACWRSVQRGRVRHIQCQRVRGSAANCLAANPHTMRDASGPFPSPNRSPAAPPLQAWPSRLTWISVAMVIPRRLKSVTVIG